MGDLQSKSCALVLSLKGCYATGGYALMKPARSSSCRSLGRGEASLQASLLCQELIVQMLRPYSLRGRSSVKNRALVLSLTGCYATGGYALMKPARSGSCRSLGRGEASLQASLLCQELILQMLRPYSLRGRPSVKNRARCSPTPSSLLRPACSGPAAGSSTTLRG